jgi:biotin synthase
MKKEFTKHHQTFLQNLADKIIAGKNATRRDAQKIISLQCHDDLLMLMAQANRIRNYFQGSRIQLCAIVNAKSGRCSEDCIFCAQSAHYKTEIESYPLLNAEKILAAAKAAQHNGATHFSIVTSGKGMTNASEFKKICTIIHAISQNLEVFPCASLGILSRDQFLMLGKAGLKRYHHTLETAPSHFGAICSTHRFAERVQTVRRAQEAGLEVCAGGIFGLGETQAQRMEMAFTLRDLAVDSVPLNFLHPIAGTPAAKFSPLAPLEILKTIALFRFVMPRTEIRICGGRETGLRTLQPFMYVAGADGTMIGNYLTTSGRNPSIDVQEIRDLNLSIQE